MLCQLRVMRDMKFIYTKDKRRASTDEYIHTPDCWSTSVMKQYYVHLLLQRIELMKQEEKNKLNGKKEQNVELIE